MVTEAQSPDTKKIVATDIDSYNVLAVLRGKYWNLSPTEINDLIVTTTPKVTRDTLQKMINYEKISEAIGELSATVYKEIIPQAAKNDIDAIMQLEAGFQAIGLKRIISSFRTMFTVSIMLSALMLLMIEIRNLSAITSGVEQKVPTEDIISNLVRPE
jgi:V/A-type H+-transporting ATPase subunit C